MANTSATGGYLLPADPPPPQGQGFDEFLQQVVARVCGLPGDMVRPRWQPEPPNSPDKQADWVALGETESLPDTFAYVDGDDLRRNESVTVLCSFYGPNAAERAARLVDGLQVEQNRYALQAANVGVTDCTRRGRVPEPFKETWRERWDVSLVLSRQIRRSYPVLTLASASGTILTDTDPQIVGRVEVTPP